MAHNPSMNLNDAFFLSHHQLFQLLIICQSFAGWPLGVYLKSIYEEISASRIQPVKPPKPDPLTDLKDGSKMDCGCAAAIGCPHLRVLRSSKRHELFSNHKASPNLPMGGINHQTSLLVVGFNSCFTNMTWHPVESQSWFQEEPWFPGVSQRRSSGFCDFLDMKQMCLGSYGVTDNYYLSY